MASAEELGDLFANLPAGEKWKFMRQFTSVRSRDEKHGVEPAPAKKAVNGFMAFRSYYSILFSGLQQKERSPFLRRLYDADPFHAEWDFVARVYSHVRNEVLKLGKQAPLRAFLATACPVMNMIAPEAYFETCGWRMEVEDGDNKSIELKCDNGADSRLSALCKTTPPLNSFDLLLRCIADGYELHNGQDVLCRMMERQEHLMTKSFPPFPTPVVNLNNSPPLPTSHSSPSPPPPGDFFTWSLPPRPSSSPPSAGGGAPPTTTTHEPGGGQILQFDIGNSYHHHHHHHGQDYASSTLQVQNQASPDGTLSEPTSQLSEVDLDLDMEPEMDVAIDMDMDSLAQYQLDLSSCGEMYKYGFTGGGHDDLGTMGMDLGMGLGQRSGLTDGDDGGIGDGALGAVEGFGMEFGVGEYLGANGGIDWDRLPPLRF